MKRFLINNKIIRNYSNEIIRNESKKYLNWKEFHVDFEVSRNGFANVKETYVLEISGYKEGLRAIPVGIKGGNDGILFINFGEFQQSFTPYLLKEKGEILQENECKFTKSKSEIKWCFTPTESPIERRFEFSYSVESVIQDKNPNTKMIQWNLTPVDLDIEIENCTAKITAKDITVDRLSAKIYEGDFPKESVFFLLLGLKNKGYIKIDNNHIGTIEKQNSHEILTESEKFLLNGLLFAKKVHH